MKLIFAIVHDEDAHKVIEELNKKGLSVTKLCSTGGFLKSGNTTLLAGVEEVELDSAIEIIKKNSKSRKQYVQSPAGFIGGLNATIPVEITVGGATVFVTDIERAEKF